MARKSLSLLLALLMVFSLFGCDLFHDTPAPAEPTESPQETTYSSNIDPDAVTILTYSNFGSSGGSFIGQFLSFANTVQSDIKVEVININLDDQAELDALCSQLKTEIMAGKGPDIYLLPSLNYTFIDSNGNTVYQESFFGDIEEAINNKMFLPLDDYIANSEHIRMENYPDIVMEAGRSEEGQVVMPLAYTYDLVLMDKSKMKDPDLSYKSLDELLSCGDINFIGSLMAANHYWFPSLWGDIADYSTGNIIISEEDLFEKMKLIEFSNNDNRYDHFKDKVSLEYYHYEEYIGTNPPSYTLCPSTLDAWYENMDNVYAAHIPNVENGMTAYVPIFTAINANSRHPDKAFKIMELLFSDAVQTGKPYDNYNSTIRSSFIRDLSVDNFPISVDINSLSREETKEFVTGMNKKITHVRFDSDLEDLLKNASSASYLFSREDDKENLQKEYIHKIYSEMQMEMAE